MKDDKIKEAVNQLVLTIEQSTKRFQLDILRIIAEESIPKNGGISQIDLFEGDPIEIPEDV